MDSPRRSQSLNSWKEISGYLGVSVRTAQKWEKERGLPVRHNAGARGRVSADTDAIDRWRESCLYQVSETPAPSPRRRHPGLIAAAAATVLLAAAAWLWRARPWLPDPVSIRVDADRLAALDSASESLWHFRLEPAVQASAYTKDPRWVFIGDLDDDGHAETLFVHLPFESGASGSPLRCIDRFGQEQWTFVPGREVSDRENVYRPGYLIQRFVVAKLGLGRKTWIVVSSRHNTDYPTQVALVDPITGRAARQYWHSGELNHILVADVNRDGRDEILLGGTNNAQHAATLVVLDPDRVAGASSEGSSAAQLNGFAPGSEMARVLFPRTCVNLKFDERNRVASLERGDGEIIVYVAETDDARTTGRFAIYRFELPLRLQNASFADPLRNYHATLRSQGLLDHDLAPEEERQLMNVRLIVSSETAGLR